MEENEKRMTEAEKSEATIERIRQSLGTSPEYRKKIQELFSKPRIFTQTAPTPTSKQDINTSEIEIKKEELTTSVAKEISESTISEPKESKALDHILKMIKMKIRPM